MISRDNDIFVGGEDKKITKYGKNLQYKKEIETSHCILIGVATRNYIIVGLFNGRIEIYDFDLKLIKSFHMIGVPTRFHEYYDYLIVGQQRGKVTVFNINSL